MKAKAELRKAVQCGGVYGIDADGESSFAWFSTIQFRNPGCSQMFSVRFDSGKPLPCEMRLINVTHSSLLLSQKPWREQRGDLSLSPYFLCVMLRERERERI